MIEYILEDGTPIGIEPKDEEQFKLDNPNAKLKSDVSGKQIGPTEGSAINTALNIKQDVGQNQGANLPPNNQQNNTESESEDTSSESSGNEYYEYGSEEFDKKGVKQGSYGKTYMPNPSGEGYDWLDTKGQYYKDESGTVYHEDLNGQVSAFSNEDEYMQHRKSLGLPQDWSGIGKAEKNQNLNKLDLAKNESKEKERTELENQYRKNWPSGIDGEDLSSMSSSLLKIRIDNPNGTITSDGNIVIGSPSATAPGGMDYRVKDGTTGQWINEEDYSDEVKATIGEVTEGKVELLEKVVKESKEEEFFLEKKEDPLEFSQRKNIQIQIKNRKKDLKEIIKQGGASGAEAEKQLKLLEDNPTKYIADYGLTSEVIEEDEKATLMLVPEGGFDDIGVLPWQFKKILEPMGIWTNDPEKLGKSATLAGIPIGLNIAGREKIVTNVFKQMYGQYGFDFREADITNQSIMITAPDGKTQIKVDLYSDDAIKEINKFLTDYSPLKSEVWTLENVAKEKEKINTESLKNAEQSKEESVKNAYKRIGDREHVQNLIETSESGKGDGGIYVKGPKEEYEEFLANDPDHIENEYTQAYSNIVQERATRQWIDLMKTEKNMSQEDLNSLIKNNAHFEDKDFQKMLKKNKDLSLSYRQKREEYENLLRFGKISEKDFEKRMASLDKLDPFHKQFLHAARDIDYKKSSQDMTEELLLEHGDASKINWERKANILDNINQLEVVENLTEKDINHKQINIHKEALDNETETIDTNIEVIKELEKDYNIKYIDNEDGSKTIDTSTIQEKSQKIFEENAPTQKEIDKGAKEIVDKIYDKKIINEDISKIKSILPTTEDVKNKRLEIESLFKQGKLTEKQANIKWDNYVKKIEAIENNVNEQLTDYEATKKKEVEDALAIYRKDIEVKNKKAENIAQGYYTKEIDKIKEFQTMSELAWIEIGDAKNRASAHYLDYEKLIEKNGEIIKNLDQLMLNDVNFDISKAEAKKIHSMYHKDGSWDSDWFTLQARKAITSFGQMFPEFLQATYDGFDKELFEPLVDKVFGEDSEFGRFTKSVVGNFALGLIFDDDSILASKDNRDRKRTFWREASEGIDNYIGRMDASIKQPMSWEDLKAGKGDNQDWTEYFMAQGLQQIPVLTTIALTGGWALPLLSINSAGGIYKDSYYQKQLYDDTGGIYGSDLSWGQMYTSAVVGGIAEGASEYITSRILGRTLNSLFGAAAKPAATGVLNYFSTILNPVTLLKGGLYTVGELGSEGLSEILASSGQNFAKRFIEGDLSVHVLDNWDESFINGVTLAGFLQSPRIIPHIINPFRGDATTGRLRNIASDIDKVTKEIADLKNYGPLFKKLDEKERKIKIKELERRHVDLVVNFANVGNIDLKRVDLFSNPEKKSLLLIEKRNKTDQDLINKILNDKRLSESERNRRIKTIENRIQNRKSRKQDILDKYPPEVVNRAYKNKMQTLKRMANMAEQMGGPKLNIKELNNEDYQKLIKEQETKRRNLSESQVENLTAELEAEYESNIDIIDNSKNKKEVAEAKKKIKKIIDDGFLAGGMNILKSSAAGVNIPIVKDGRIIGMELVVNKDAVVENGLFNTAAHEFIHATFANTLKADPKMRQILGGQLQKIIDGKGVTFKPGKKQLFDKRVEQYREDKQGEEMLAIMAEMILDGDIKIDNNFAEKATGVFRRFAQTYFNRGIKFDGPQSMKKFLTDFNYSIKNNKPSKAIAKLIASSDNTKKGRAFENAKFSFDGEMEFSLALDKSLKSNPDLKDEFDSLVQEADGSPKHKNNADFKTSPEYIEGYNKIMDSKLLDGLIKQGMTDKGLPGEALKDFTRKVKEQIGDRYLTNFNLDKNDSLFGWLTGVSGGAGQSIIYRAKGDVMKQYVKEGRAQDVSIDKQIGEAGTLADVMQAEKDNLIDQIENADMTPASKRDLKSDIKGLKMVMDLLGLPKSTKKAVTDAVVEANVPITILTDGVQVQDLTYKNIRDLLLSTEVKITTEKKATPVGPLFGVLNAIASEFGIDPLRILAKQDLNAEQRKAAQQFIFDKAVNSDGSFNKDILEALPEGQDRSGKSTGVANTKLGQFYVKGKRAKMKAGATAAGLAEQTKRTDITKEEFLNLFGINPDGSLQPGTKADGAIRELVVQMSQLAANQSIRIEAVKNKVESANAIAKLKDGMSDAMYSDILEDANAKMEAEDMSSDLFELGQLKPGDMIKLLPPGAIDKFKGRLNKIAKDKTRIPASLRKEIKKIIEEFIKADPRFLYILGTGMTFGRMRSIFGVKGAFKEFSPEIRGALKDVTKAFVYTNKKRTLDNITKDPKTGKLKFKNPYDTRKEKARIKSDDTLTKAQKEKKLADLQVLTLEQFQQYELEKNDLLVKLYDTGANLGTEFAYFLKAFHANSSNQMAGLQRSSAFMVALPRNPDGTLDVKSSIEQEHMMPQNIVGSMLFGAALKGPKHFQAAMKVIEKAYGQMPLRKVLEGNTFKETGNLDDHDGMVEAAGYADSMPDFFRKYIMPRILDNSLDYLPNGLAAIVRYTKSGINLNGYELLDGQTITEYFGVDVKNFNELSAAKQQEIVKAQNTAIEQILSGVNEATGLPITKEQAIANVQATVKLSESTLSYSLLVEGNKSEIDSKKDLQLRIQESSNSMSSKIPPKVQGLSVFDFDDTLGVTKSGVLVKLPNHDGNPKPKRKVIFLAGGAGSGKGNVIKKLNLERDGFKIVNSDISLEWLKKNSGLPADMKDLTREQRSTLSKLGAEARKIARKKMMKYQGGANGVVVDGTGGSAKQMQKLVDQFKEKGYDTSMLFVDTSLDTAIQRNKARKERSLLDKIVKSNHKAVQGNKDSFKEMFGDTFMEVNTDNLTQESSMPTGLISQMNDFVNGYEKRRIDAAEFAEKGDQLLREGAEFDFSEFDKVVEGRPGPLLDKALERAKRFGTKDIFVLTARTPKAAEAIQQFLKSQGLDIPLKNITGLANSTGAAKAQWMLDKFTQGYNDMYFADDALQNVEAVKEVLDQLDIKSDVVQAKADQMNRLIDNSDSMESKIIEPDPKDPNKKDPIDKEFNDMIERKKGIDSDAIISRAEARKRGSETNIIRFLKSIYIPPSAEDFKGLLYYFVGKGKQGDADLKWFKEKLFDPFAKGVRSWNAYKQNMVDEYKALKKKFPSVNKILNKKVPGTIWTNDTAIRVYLWNKAGFNIPGIDDATIKKLVNHVNNNPDIKAFADGLSIVTRRAEGYVNPSENWMMESISSDMNNLVNKVGRKEFLQEWVNIKNIIFSKDNLNKIRATYGDGFTDALENILYRMENGGNRIISKDKVVNRFTNWINNSVGAIMFVNMRSALLQTISTVNFINWSDNNIFKASAAFANVPQFWSDFAMLFNSPQLKQRRKGLQTDVSASELQKTFSEKGFSPGSVINYLLQKGFLPTQIADSFAIAFGGASFYRNRFNKYKKEGMSDKQANERTMLDFQEIAEETQQSSREDLVSQEQASVLGRIVLAFQNVTMQMGRLTKKSLSDLVNGRGDFKTNVSKILYYGMVQNIVFASLQSALAMIMWGDDEEEIENRTVRAANQALDSFLRGMGLYGALISTLKNTIRQWHVQKALPYGKRDKMKIAQEMINLSPPIGSKIRKIMNAFNTELYNKGVSEKIGFRIENPELRKWASIIEATTNIPLARVVNKANNLEEAITGDHLIWQRVALTMGWNKWDIGVKDEELEAAKIEVEEEKKEKKKIEKEKKKEEEKIIKEEEKKKEEERKKEEGIKTVRCSGIRSNGLRCNNVTETSAKSWKCVHHKAFKDGSDTDGDGIKEYRCTATKSNGNRCKNKTENTNKKCYAHQ